MGKGVEEVVDEGPRTERNNGDNSDPPAGDDQCLRPQTLDQSSEGEGPPCKTPTTTSSEDADKGSDDAVAATSSEVDDANTINVVSIADHQTLSQPKGEAKIGDRNKNEDGDEEKDGSEVEDETEPSGSKTPEIDPAKIKLPKSPYFNPFDAPSTDKDTSSRRGSMGDIPSLDDMPAYVEPLAESLARREWTRRKEQLDEKNEALVKMMDMVGIEAAKAAFLEAKDVIDASRSRQGHLKRQVLNMVVTGNPGTGKRTVAKLYYDLLRSCDVWGQKPTNVRFEERSGHYLGARGNILDLLDIVEKGVLYISNAEFVNSNGRALFMDILKELSEDVVIVLSGSSEEMPVALGSCPTSRWLFPRHLQTEDYNDEELRRLFVQMVRQDSFRIERGPQGPFTRIVTQRVGRARDEADFGNIHELRLACGRILERYSTRMRQRLLEVEDSWTESMPDENLLTGQDLIGPEPADVRAKSEAWKKLEKMAGLEVIKAAVDQLLHRLKGLHGAARHRKDHRGQAIRQILADIGLVSSRTVIYKTPGDFIGQVFGESEDKTNAILDSAKGKVLIIDDAHMFYQSGELGEKKSDEFRLACIDVIVSKIHNKPGDDRCVILVGYPDRMEEMLQKCNLGLRRRFPLEEAFRFYDYDDAQLKEILDLKMDEDGIKATPAAIKAATEVLRRARDRPNFGNGGDVVNFLNQAKARHRARVSNMVDSDTMDIMLEPEDFDSAYDRGATAAERCRAHFHGLTGFEDTIQRFESYQRIAENLRLNNKDPRGIIPFNYVFKGPPGTGKTHTARIIGRIFYDMGFLSTSEVIECSATHLLGKYVGHTGPKVVELFERALGKVLFIDEAYRLGASGKDSFASEAIGEIVDCMTKPRYYRKMVIVLAGYTHDMDRLLEVNAGLRGRFATEIEFLPMSPEDALRHLCELLAKQDIVMLEDEDDDGWRETVMGLFGDLAETKGWSNGRDMQTLAGGVTEYVYGNLDGSGRGLGIPTREVVRLIGDMLQQRVKGGLEQD